MSEKHILRGGEWIVKIVCRDCGHKWTGRYKANSQEEIKPKPCPKCKAARKQRDGLKEIIDSGRAPAYSGTNVKNVALDVAAEMVMQDHGMTDIKSPTEIRQGESQAPKIAPHLQAQADAMFGGARKALRGTGLENYGEIIKRGALSGVISPHRTGSPDPVNIVQSQQRKADLMARTKIINEKDK